MKTKIGLFTIVYIMVFIFESNAQTAIFGVKAGLNLTDMLDKDSSGKTSNDYKMKPGFHFGVSSEFSISEKFAIEPGFVFSTKGYRTKEAGTTMNFNLNNIEIPLNAVYKIDLTYLLLLVNAGPYLGVTISGKLKSNEKIFTDRTNNKVDKMNINIGRYKSDGVKQIDYGVNFGVGVDMESITFGIQYGLGLANIAPIADNGRVFQHKVIGVSIGYKFGEPYQDVKKKRARGKKG